MTAVNGSSIAVKGTVYITVFINHLPYDHKFVVADVSHNILGFDFWSEHDLTIRPVPNGVEVFPFQTPPAFRPMPARRTAFGFVNAIYPSNKEETNKQCNNRLHTVEQMTDTLTIPGEESEVLHVLKQDFTVNAIEDTLPENTIMPYIPVGNLPYYKPGQVHNCRPSLVNMVKGKDEEDTLLYAHHLDMYQGLSDPKKEEATAQLIKDRSQQDLDTLSTTFPDCFKEEVDYTKPSKIPVVHYIEFEDDYKYKAPFIYKVNIAFHDKVKAQLAELEKKGIIEVGNSEFAAPLCVVPKANSDELRLCGDFRAINQCTRPDRYPLPRIDEIKQKVNGYVFSVLDLKNGFYQIPIYEGHKHKTAMHTPFGLYVYNRMPFGLRNAPPTFQRFMDRVIQQLDNVIAYVDDVIIYSSSYEDHLVHLHNLFERFNTYQLIINFKKSHFFQTEVTYLGFLINSRGYRPSQLVIPKFDKLEPPIDKEGVQRFLGIINYYREHMPNMSEFGSHLYGLVKKYVKFRWTEEHQKEFEVLKKMCQERLLLVPFRVGVPAAVYTDASCMACGAVLVQDNKLVQCYSKSFNPTEQHYSTFDRECYGMVLAVKHFRHLLIGTPFTVYTDHKPLLKWLTRPPVSERHARWLTQVQDIIEKIEYIPGPDNVLADLLSRPRGLLKSIKDDYIVASVDSGWKEEMNSALPTVVENKKKKRRWQPRYSYINRVNMYQAMREAAGTMDYRLWYINTLKPKFFEIKHKVEQTYGKKVARKMDMRQYGNHFGIDPQIIYQVAPEWDGNMGERADLSYVPTISLSEASRDLVVTRSKSKRGQDEQRESHVSRKKQGAPLSVSANQSLHYSDSLTENNEQNKINEQNTLDKVNTNRNN